MYIVFVCWTRLATTTSRSMMHCYPTHIYIYIYVYIYIYRERDMHNMLYIYI